MSAAPDGAARPAPAEDSGAPEDLAAAPPPPPASRTRESEVAHGLTGIVPVRDSKDPDGPALVLGARAWSAFIDGVKTAH